MIFINLLIFLMSLTACAQIEPQRTTVVNQQDIGMVTKNQLQELEKSGQYLEILRLYSKKMNEPGAAPSAEEARLKSVDLIENRLSEAQLEEVGSSSEFNFLQGYANFKLAEIFLDKKDTSSAKKFFTKASYFAPGSDISVRAQDMISQLESTRHVEPKTIGAILPLSGKNASIGQRTLRSMQLGLGLNQKNSTFKLAVIDSEGNADTARRAVEKLVKDDNVIAIIGSLLSKTATAEASKSDELGIPMIALSQKSNITDIGPNIFRNSITSQMQVRYLVKQAMEIDKLKKFAILYPNDSYGVEFANIFWDEVLVRGGKIVSAQSYNPKDTDFRQVAQRLVGTYYIEDRADEFKMRERDLLLADKDKKKSIRENTKEDILPPIVDFDAIFIPDSSKPMGQVAAFLSFVGIRNVQLLGTNLWNSPGLSKRAGNFSSNLRFVDGIFPDSNIKFFQDYKSFFNEDPTLTDLQAYDSALLIRQLVLNGAESREEITSKLKSLNKFPGTLGPLSISKDREILRPLFSFTLEKGELKRLH